MRVSKSSLPAEIFLELSQQGVQEICFCPGARNAPLLEALTQVESLRQKFKVYYHFEERSAAFFALGVIQRTGRPVAVVTTSGTAVGELLPATMEAHYSSLPLILVTADRPRSYRGSGAPQCAEQVGIFGTYVFQGFDLTEGDSLDALKQELSQGMTSPLHLNLCFDEPLWQGQTFSIPELPVKTSVQKSSAQTVSQGAVEALSLFLSEVSSPWIIVGYLSPKERESVSELLIQLKFPTYFESLSGISEDPRFERFRIRNADLWLGKHFSQGTSKHPRGVIRLGGIPTHRFWRDLEYLGDSTRVLSMSSRPFTGLARSSQFWCGDLNELQPCRPNGTSFTSTLWKNEELEAIRECDREFSSVLKELLDEEPQSECGMVARLAENLPPRSRIYLGNSLPIRNWDLVNGCRKVENQFEMSASRGLNGIDGQISTFLGFSAPREKNWALIGDLTALYDLAGPWILPQLRETSAQILVMNNGGGKIFSKIFPVPEFQNQHDLDFRGLAELWRLPYERWNSIPSQLDEVNGSRIVEIRPDPAATERFSKNYSKLLQEVLARRHAP